MIQLTDPLTRGPGVRAWQRICGVPLAKVDGIYGPATVSYVKGWQIARGVPGDGVIGPLSRAAVLPADLIKPFEGCVLQTYDDSRDGTPLSARLLRLVGGVWRRPDGTRCLGTPTIGWGDTNAPKRGVEFCTHPEADQWFADDLARTRLPTVLRFVDPQDAAKVLAGTCFAYNVGIVAFEHMMLGGVSKAEWLSYDHDNGVQDPGLLMRREEEWAVWADET